MTPNEPLRFLAVPVLVLALAAAPAAAQAPAPRPASGGNPFLGGVPSGAATATPLALSIADAIHRALEHNLGVLLSEQARSREEGTRWMALSHLLPQVDASVSEVRRKNNLEAFGFPLRNDFPRVVGPFNVFDARVFLSQSIVDFDAMNAARAEGHSLAAARHSYQDARDMVVLVAANLYLQSLAASARADAADAQRDTAQALYDQAVDLRQGGIVAGIDVVRAEVRLDAETHAATAARNDFEKSKLQLARVIGLPIGQAFTLSDQLPDAPVPEMTLDAALAEAYARRPDYLAAQERVQAAEASRKAAIGESLPSVRLLADYGAIGLTAGSALTTFSVSGAVNIPLFTGGRTMGRRMQANAELRERRAEAEDLRAQIYYDVRSAFLDLDATRQELQVATRGRELANLQLTQARDRFAAGVTSNIEVVQSQEAVATATAQYIDALYGFNVAKAMLARALGVAESAVEQYLGGANQ